MYLVIYVDDIFIISDADATVGSLKMKLSGEFEMKVLHEVSCFLGLNIRHYRAKEVMTIDQHQYVRNILEDFGMNNCHRFR